MIVGLLMWVALAGVSVVVVVSYRTARPDVAVGVLFVASSFSRLTAPLGPYQVRPEQPALICLAALAVWRERAALLDVIRRHRWLFGFAVVYLAANALASAVAAARPLDSLRIAGWLALSMLGGLVVAAIVGRAPEVARRLPAWIVGAAAFQVLVGLAAVASQAVLGTTWGVQVNDVVLGKTYGLSWEANILAINLAMAVAFLLVPPSGLRLSPPWRVAATIWLALGLGLAYSRGGAIALMVGVAVFGLLVTVSAGRRSFSALRTLVGPSVALGSVSVVVALLTVGSLEALATRGVGLTPDTVIVGSPQGPGATPIAAITAPTQTAAGSIGATPVPSPTPRYVGTGDTLELRLNDIRIGMDELQASPIIGLGTDSFSQRHIEPSCICPAHISNLLFATLYESGVVGLIGLGGLLAGTLLVAWRSGEWAYFVAIVAMIVGYQATDAFRFASNWIVLGAVAGSAVMRPRNMVAKSGP